MGLKETAEQKLSIQKKPAETSVSFFMAQTGGLAPAWWTPNRDLYLRRSWQECDAFAGAMYAISSKLAAVPFRIEPRDPQIKSHWKQAEKYEIALYEGADFGKGWVRSIPKSLLDLWSTDNGFHWEIIGAGNKNGPIKGPAVGIASLDSGQCTRTGNPEYPVIYQRHDGKRYRLHHTRVASFSQLPSPVESMHDVGFCWFSRCLATSQGVIDILRYKMEKLGSRPWRGIIYGSGVPDDVLLEAVQVASEQADNVGLARFARIPIVTNPSASGDVTLNLLDLASLPDGFDYERDLTLAMYTIALTGGFPPRWLWPATVSGATKADALYQHIAGSTSGAGQTLGVLQTLLGGSERGKYHSVGKFLPSHLRMVFDFQDDELDRMRAEIKEIRSERHERDVADGIITIRIAREQMLSDSDITESQFQDMELEDGRTPDGLNVLDLFYQDIELLKGIDPENPDIKLATERMHEAKRIFTTSTSNEIKREARQAVAALEALLEQEGETEEREEEQEEEEAVSPEKRLETLAIRKALDNYEQDKIDAGELANFALENAMDLKELEDATRG